MSDYVPKLLAWYASNKRELPWRNSGNPYFVWLSEIILQQTRVDQGLPYYLKFINRYPTVEQLALADEQEVFKLWQGLGYYSRASNMLKSAQVIASKYHGEFPVDLISLKKLPGIGPYTAAAIASIAFNLPHAVVDGNVYRVLSRLMGLYTPINTAKSLTEFTHVAQKLMGIHHPGMFNQSLMELGALICKPQSPDCESCPLQNDCYAWSEKVIPELPVRLSKVKQKTIYFTYFVLHVANSQCDSLYFKQRESKGIWAKLYDFPCLESEHPLEIDQAMNQAQTKGWLSHTSFVIKKVSPYYKHLLTHRKIWARFVSIQLKVPLSEETKKELLLIKHSMISQYPVPVLVERYLQKEKLLDG